MKKFITGMTTLIVTVTIMFLCVKAEAQNRGMLSTDSMDSIAITVYQEALNLAKTPQITDSTILMLLEQRFQLTLDKDQWLSLIERGSDQIKSKILEEKNELEKQQQALSSEKEFLMQEKEFLMEKRKFLEEVIQAYRAGKITSNCFLIDLDSIEDIGSLNKAKKAFKDCQNE